MTILDNFDPFSDFWISNPQARIFFKEEYESSVPSSDMWALFLFYHPSSKLFNESPSSRKKLILSDYPVSPDFSFEKYSSTVEKIKKYSLSRAELMLLNWATKLHERDDFIESVPYSADTFKMLDSMIDVTPSMWKQYETIRKLLSQEQEGVVVGDQEESLSEKKLI